MAAKKCKCEPGVPEWVVTYGDLMSLLLVFFILLAAVSELRKDEEFQNQVKAIREAFGYVQGGGVAPVVDSPQTSIMSKLDAVALFKRAQDQISNGEDPGIVGKEPAVQTIREGMQFVVGGVLTFEPGSATLSAHALGELRRLAEEIRGQNNKVEIRGHAANRDQAADSVYADLWQLSHARADAVRQALVTDFGIDPRRLRVVASANHEPLAARVYQEHRHAVNRRVEIIVKEVLMQDFEGQGDDPVLPIFP
ncbi:MAG: flagellar motor protein MotB [Phycisphaeraceae bacterium]